MDVLVRLGLESESEVEEDDDNEGVGGDADVNVDVDALAGCLFIAAQEAKEEQDRQLERG